MKTLVMKLLAVILLAVAAAAAFVYSGAFDVSALSPHGTATNWLMTTVREASVSRRAASIDVPDLQNDALRQAGINDFEAMCVACHGAPGSQPTPIAQGLNPPAPDLREIARERSAAELFWVTKHGIRMTGMPAWGASHDDDALWPVVALLVALPDMDSTAYQALLMESEGKGHHGNDDHSHEAAEHDSATETDDSAEPEHDHSTHDH